MKIELELRLTTITSTGYSHRMHTIMRLTWGVFVAIMLSGCAPLGFKCYEGHFPGLSTRFRLAAEHTNTVHFVLVHGMTDHCPGYGNTFADGIAARLQLTNNTDEKTIVLPLPEANAENVLRNFSYSSGRTQMFVHELTWTPTTYALKTNSFAEDRRLNHRRVHINRKLKSKVIDEGFGDAVLYLNPSFQTNMQKPIQQTIDYVLQNSGSNDPIVLVASSLGSKMTFDTVEKWASGAADEFAGRTAEIIMLANQVPLFNLGTRTITNGQFPPSDSSLKSFLMRGQRRKAQKIQEQKTTVPPTEETPPNVIHVVAATDPNDLLSFPIRPRDIPPPSLANDRKIEVLGANIYSHNAWAIPWLFENPDPAHTAYDANAWLLKKLVRGFSSTNACFPKAVAFDPTCEPDQKKRTPGKRF